MKAIEINAHHESIFLGLVANTNMKIEKRRLVNIPGKVYYAILPPFSQSDILNLGCRFALAVTR